MNTSLLKQKAKMLEEYFNIYIDSNGNLSRLPVLLDQYTPDMDHVLEFVLCLGNDVGDGSQFYMKGTSSSSINGQGNSSKTTELKLRSSDESRIFQEQGLGLGSRELEVASSSGPILAFESRLGFGVHDVLVLLSAELQVDHNGVRSNAANLHALHRCLYITILNLDRSKRLATRCEPIDGDHKRVASVIAAALGHPSGVVKDVDRYLQLRHRVVHGLGALGVGRLHGGAVHALLRRVAAHPPRIGQSRLGNRGCQRQWGLLSSRHDLGGFGEIVEAQLVVVGVVASFLDQREVRIGCGC
nr:DNA mismatch repair protein MLH1 [Ipomoea batatas]